MPVDTLAKASRCARRMLSIVYRTSGIRAPIEPVLWDFTRWQASKHVERYTGVRLLWADVHGKQLGAREVEKRFQRPQRSGGSGQEDLVLPIVSALHPRPDPVVYGSMTSEILAVMLLVAGWSTMASSLAEGFELAQILCGEGPVNTRVREVLLPQLAAKDVGEPHHLTAPQWEVVLYEALVPYAGITMQKSDLHCPMYDKARELLVHISQRIKQLDPDRPLSHRWLAMTFSRPQEPADAAELYSAAASMIRLGCEQGHDYAAALGGYLALFAQLRAEGRAPGLPAAVRAGELRGALAAARAARRRLERWGMWEEVHTQIPDHLAEIEAAAAALQDIPDDEEVPLPYVPAGMFGWGDWGSDADDREEAEKEEAEVAMAEKVFAKAGLDPACLRDPELMQRTCQICWKQYDKFRRCGGCKQRRYCSTQCQASDWQRGHKEECRRLAELTAAAEDLQKAEAAAAEAAAAAAAAGTSQAAVAAAAAHEVKAVALARVTALSAKLAAELEAAAVVSEGEAAAAAAAVEVAEAQIGVAEAQMKAVEAQKEAAEAKVQALLAAVATAEAEAAAAEAAEAQAAGAAAEAEAAEAEAEAKGAAAQAVAVAAEAAESAESG
ncbi:hypothetical protein HYH03_005847 [Edaphochlamys debaryana]|uniref:MYND-type domain-containing protein n=1 Tax=Edaphochlamys debaryana TaxID=47281 RepID=A0A835YEQ5_9CHLO|nr:hypothetical protein HYH03_005847 [Edaphochlamys debaryana]|eukprot:KAG2496249.1 hypothetical protein HYH03_005847 [Edaphochlamys debaryana]